ncbi:MAG: FAD-dependent oxidoreductase [Phormidium sp.]
MKKVVVIGAGLGGLPTAYELRHLLPKEQIILISDQPKFTFIPGLIRVALHLNPLEEIQLDLAKLTKQHGIDLILGKVVDIDPESKNITWENISEPIQQEIVDYDYVAIATGASFDFDAVPGLGPHQGYTHSVCTPAHALQAREAWLKFLANPGPLVVGAMAGASCFGPAYEFLLMAEWELRRRGLRDQVSITYITPEPYAGHLGLDGLSNSKELTEKLLEKRGIKVFENAQITSVDAQVISLKNGSKIPFEYAMILPSFLGAKFIQNLPELGNEKGFIPVLSTYEHPKFSSVYALGVTVELKPPKPDFTALGVPKSGQMAEGMGLAVAHNIAIKLGRTNDCLKTATLEVICFAEFGDTGIVYVAAPVLPDPKTGRRRYSYAMQGRWVNWVKAAFEKYFLLKLKLGWGVPWFELLGLRILFGLSLLKNSNL